MKDKSDKRRALWPWLGALVFGVVVLAIIPAVRLLSPGRSFAKTPVEIAASPGCGCCKEYAAHLGARGFTVTFRDDIPNLDQFKRNLGMDPTLWSCHTAIIGDYFVEGHVPVDVINKLLDEQPNIDGIALPGMPSGTPGMPGPKTEPWPIYALVDGTGTMYYTD